MSLRKLFTAALAGAVLSLAAAIPAQAQYSVGDREIDGSLCVGTDCVNGESFSFDTVRLKENNTRLKFMDTSSSASFPQNDWQLRANESANGGRNAFFIDDMGTANTIFQTPESTPFAIEANANNWALYVDDAERVGLSTSNPAVELHIVDGNTPTVRLEQDGSSGFAPQTWDMAGNETNFFIRDVTHGSALPFRIQPDAPTNSLYIALDGDVGLGTASPDADLEISTDETFTFFRMTATGATVESADVTYTNGGGGEIRYNIVDGDGEEMSLDLDGNLEVAGNIVSGGGGTCDPGPCDAVFDPAVYTVPSIEDHAAFMWENKRLPALDPTLPGQPFNMTLKVTRMLNELEHAHIYIEQLNDAVKGQNGVIAAQSAEIAELRTLIDSLTAK